MKIETRYRYEDVPMSRREAQKIRRDEIEHIQNQIDELKNELRDLKYSPLRTMRRKQISLEPGDPGYEDAPVAFHAGNYQGDLKWLSSESHFSPQTSPAESR